MTIQDLPNVKLSEATRGYLAIYLKLSDLYGELDDVTSIEYAGCLAYYQNAPMGTCFGD